MLYRRKQAGTPAATIAAFDRPERYKFRLSAGAKKKRSSSAFRKTRAAAVTRAGLVAVTDGEERHFSATVVPVDREPVITKFAVALMLVGDEMPSSSNTLDASNDDLSIARATSSVQAPAQDLGVAMRPSQGLGSSYETAARFPAVIDAIAEAHRPSNMPFFHCLSTLPPHVARDPRLLGDLYLIYQAAMHATRAAVYFLPHLDSPELRKRKLQIFVDDDGLPGGDTHHYQLTRAFRNIGALCPLSDEEFGGAEELARHLDAPTAHFIRLAKKLYANSLGPWCIVETMSDNWMHALASSLALHFPSIVNEPYFADCFAQGVEERHAEEAIAVTVSILTQRPELLAETIADARTMADALDGIWISMEQVVRSAISRHESAREVG